MDKELLFECKPKYYIFPGLKDKTLKYVQLDPDIIIKTVGNHFNITVEVMTKKGRGKRDVLLARYMAIHFIFKYTKLAKIKIGKKFNRDHTSIIYAIDTFNDWMDTEPELTEQVAEIKNILAAL